LHCSHCSSFSSPLVTHNLSEAIHVKLSLPNLVFPISLSPHSCVPNMLFSNPNLDVQLFGIITEISHSHCSSNRRLTCHNRYGNTDTSHGHMLVCMRHLHGTRPASCKPSSKKRYRLAFWPHLHTHTHAHAHDTHELESNSPKQRNLTSRHATSVSQLLLRPFGTSG